MRTVKSGRKGGVTRRMTKRQKELSVDMGVSAIDVADGLNLV